ncbi:hypothetical protein BKH46_06595 [Helicobacter sp. 12S02634-8]|uniref:hypothetical protein n=1 Tax=Helicobacter sp. 12S02634-8 TaxID=1476199 RepID=UPI000BA78E7B|nr:hypothetical protein [Helicobacter sp. 12S02634-8]PAF46632.1 hypothetical protein BKH46_06595 [Helicobacter sp. 12S02634-8]
MKIKKNARYSFWITAVASVLFLYGCSQPPSPQIATASQKCATPLGKIHISAIESGQNDLDISPEFIKSLLEQSVQDNCLELTNTPDTNTYETTINYSTSLKSFSDEKIASAEVKNTIGANISFVLKSPSVTKTFEGKSAMEIGGKKILSIGQDASVTQADKDQIMAQAFGAAYQSALSSFKPEAK